MSREQLLERIAPFASVTLDIGAGDGRFAYRYAQAHPDRFVIAVEPVRENVREISAKASRKPARGGLPNVLFVAASVEAMPAELQGIAQEVLVTLPWGSLMRGLILGEQRVLAGVACAGADGATVRIVLNTRIFEEPLPIEARGLPEVTPEYAETLRDTYAAAGMEITRTAWMAADEVAALDTTWAKRLSHRAPPRSVLIEARIHAARGLRA